MLVKVCRLVQVGVVMGNLLDTKFLFASLLWGAIGVGYFVYGKKQQSLVPLVGGLVMIALSYLVESWFWMSLAGTALMAAIYWLSRQGY
ncbi:MAG TPA: amino acid transport protein [Verrucomicrobiota bacterium]|nr:amino acid transport protein [Verrucomicrobiota bacterium]HNT13776.1 amino acid transport protein [Verrucomicrobiota bacterium]